MYLMRGTLVGQGSACNRGCGRRLPSASVLWKCLICVRLETSGPQPAYLWVNVTRLRFRGISPSSAAICFFRGYLLLPRLCFFRDCLLLRDFSLIVIQLSSRFFPAIDSISPDQNILQSPDGKVGVYTRFFDFANCRILLSQFLVDVLCHFRIHLFQLSVFGAAKFVKRSDAAPVCHNKPSDAVKNWNDHFFWVDSTAFPLSVSLKSKILSKDPPPKLSQYDTEACDFLQMDLFALICHSDPTKVGIGEREPAERVVKLLTLTEGRTVSLNPPVRETVAKDVSEVATEKTKKKQKRKVVGDASGSTFPPKRLKEDHHAAASNTGGKSLAAICDLVPDGSSVPSGVTEPLTVVSVPPTPDDGPTDSVYRLNLCTYPPSLRYIESSDDSHRLGSCFEVKSFARSPAADVSVTTVSVSTIVTANASGVSPPKVRVVSKNLEIVRDSSSAGGANANDAGTSKLNEPADSSDSFYALQDLDSETLHRIYVPKWNVTNDSVLDCNTHKLGRSRIMYPEALLHKYIAQAMRERPLNESFE
nr:hypothetical protein [Tanacetum cinerariifolium]